MSHRWRMNGKCVLVTGASRGIGLACAQEMAGLGADVLMLARDELSLERSALGLQNQYPEQHIDFLSADVSDGDGRAAVMEWLRELQMDVDVLVNNVGNNIRQSALGYSDQDLQFIFQTNVASCFELSRLMHPILKHRPGAAIVNVASVSGLTHVRTGVAYGMSKAAIVQMTKNLACEWAPDGIRVNAVAPWYIRTQRTDKALDDPDYLDEVLARTPMGRIGEPAEVAAAVAFLAMPCASYITGECVAVDGGFLRFGF